VDLVEDIGGELIDSLDPVDSDASAFDKVMAKLSDSSFDAEESVGSSLRAIAGDNIGLPRPLRDCIDKPLTELDWQWLGFGVRYSAIASRTKGTKVGLLKIAPNTKIPSHGHTGSEMTMVLSGGYSDAMGKFGIGDVEIADNSTVHQPISDSGGECICLVVISGQQVPTGILAKAFKPFFTI
jgi:putative transcriptional regulator